MVFDGDILMLAEYFWWANKYILAMVNNSHRDVVVVSASVCNEYDSSNIHSRRTHNKA